MNDSVNDLVLKNRETIADIACKAGVSLQDCYQCGKCSAGCPMAEDMDLLPRQIIRCLQLGMLDEALHSRSPWICAACHTCSERCPNQIDVCAVMESVRQEADRRNIRPVRTVSLFTKDFLLPVALFGRSHEMIMTACYNLTSGHVFQNFRYLPKMIRGGKLRILPHCVKDKKHIRRIMENCEEAECK